MKKTIYLLLCSVLFSSCGKRLIYFQQKKESQNTYQNIQLAKAPDIKEHIVEEGDVLHIRLFSSDENLIAMFNQNVLDETNSISGFEVKNNGSIFIPFVGSLPVKGLSVAEAENVVRDSLSAYISNPNLVLDLTAFKVVVLGSVNRPGPVLVPSDKASIIDVIALAGDLGMYGNPNNIKVVRDVDGKKVQHFIDLSDVDVFKDSFYYIGSNDIIYVEPLKRRFLQENVTVLSLAATVLNFVTLVAIRF